MMGLGQPGGRGRTDELLSARLASAHGAGWRLRAAQAADLEPLAELRAVVMRADLQRLGRYDEHRVRQRLRESFSTRHTCVIVIGDGLAGSVTLRPAEGGRLLEHFYLAARHQGHGLGSAILRTLLQHTDELGVTVRLTVLQGSAAQRLYERHGFVVEHQDPIDVFLVRSPQARAGPGDGGKIGP